MTISVPSGTSGSGTISGFEPGTQGCLLAFSIVYNLLAVGLAAAGRMNPLVAAVLMPASSLATLLIVATGLRGIVAREK